MGSTKKRRVPKSKRIDWKAAFARLEKMHSELHRARVDLLDKLGNTETQLRNATKSNEELAGQVNGARSELLGCLPKSRTEHCRDLVELAKMASAAVQNAQSVTSGAAKAMRAAGYAASSVEEVAKIIGGARFLRPGETVVAEHQVRIVKGMLDDLLAANDD